MNKLTTLILTAILSLFTANAFAGGGSTKYYYKVTATATPSGAGKVYASSDTEPTDDSYAEESTATFNSALSASNANLFAKANDGYKFLGWKTSVDANEYVSTDAFYQPDLLSSSTSSSRPTAFQYYAIFAENGEPILAYANTHVYVDKGNTTTNELEMKYTTEDATFTSSNTNVATVAADGTVTGVDAGSAVITAAANGTSAKYVVTVLDYSEAGKTQIGNGNFEDWRNVTDNNHAPYNWNSFETAEGQFATTVGAQQIERSEDVRPGSNGLYSAHIYSRNVIFSIVAQGNLTTGCINAGSMSATDGANHNFSKISDETKSETINKIPSAIRCWVKFVPGKENAEHPNARIAASIHDAYNYITYATEESNTDENKSHHMAQAELNFPACDWQELTIPFVLTETWADTTGSNQWYILVNISTNADPAQGQVNDHLYIDDIELLYEKDMEPVVTGISEIQSNTARRASYNLAGQRVNGNAKGIIIVDGKKIVK